MCDNFPCQMFKRKILVPGVVGLGSQEPWTPLGTVCDLKLPAREGRLDPRLLPREGRLGHPPEGGPRHRTQAFFWREGTKSNERKAN